MTFCNSGAVKFAIVISNQFFLHLITHNVFGCIKAVFYDITHTHTYLDMKYMNKCRYLPVFTENLSYTYYI